MSFRRLVLFSALTALLALSLVYGIRYEFIPSNTAKTSLTSTSSHGWTVFGLPEAQLLIFAYSGEAGGFVQASVSMTGQYLEQEAYNDSTGKERLLYVPTTFDFNGTTSTDLQNPLVIIIPNYGGNYTVYGTYGSASLHNVTWNLSEDEHLGEVILNFGSSPPPPLGHLWVGVWYNNAGGFVKASVAITGPESLNATTHDETSEAQAVFTLPPGAYTVTATYASFAPKTETVTLTAGGFASTYFSFSAPPPS
jgi:hypothetical protein